MPTPVDAIFEKLNGFAKPMMDDLRAAIREAAPSLTEELKWGTPSYSGKGIVCGIAAFKAHVSITFWRGAELKDPNGLLLHGMGRSAMRSAKFPEGTVIGRTQVAAWVKEAVKLDAANGPAKAAKRKPVVVKIPPALAKALKADAAARATFEKLPPSAKRDYCEWLSEAKQAATAKRRLASTLEKLGQGEGLNDKYKNC